jgi:hypothetical protein
MIRWWWVGAWPLAGYLWLLLACYFEPVEERVDTSDLVLIALGVAVLGPAWWLIQLACWMNERGVERRKRLAAAEAAAERARALLEREGLDF